MAARPKYLTSPGHAIAQRVRWQNRLTEEMLFITLHNPNARWSTLVNKMARDIETLPRWARPFLLAADPVQEDAYETVEALARTIATATYNEHVGMLLAAEGIAKKRWVTRHDLHVRETHRKASGQTRILSNPFLVGGYHLQWPGDSRTAPIDLWMNCRCVLIGVP